MRYTAHGNKRQGTRDLLGAQSGEWSEINGGLGGVSTGCHQGLGRVSAEESGRLRGAA